MKKLYFFCIALVALMLASCGGKDYREMLPADSFVIVSINPESLSRKAQVGDFTQSVYYKMAEQALADAPEEERGRILSLLAHPSETGLDVGSDVFMFVTMENASQTGNPTVGGLFKVGDRKKLDSFLGWLSQKSGFTSFKRMESPSLPIRRARICLSSLMTKRPFWSIPLPLTMIRRKLPPRSSSPRRKQRV